MMAYLLVAMGGALGSIARFWASGVVSNHFIKFPWFGTLAVNVTGSFVIGFFGALTSEDSGSRNRITIIQFVMYGICGGYTTFSSFSLQTFNLLRDGEWLYAGGNVLLSVVLCMVAVWLGWLAGTALHSLKG